jgi:hypothetical protein
VAAKERHRNEIRLILQITVDGLRRDLLDRYSDRFSGGGFRLLTRTGTLFANAHYQHANTETIVGHVTLATGASPSDHGMIGNVWYDRDTHELAYNIEDPDHPPLASREGARSGEQVDPAQKLARTRGRSPRAILAETFADRLTAYSGRNARAFSVSGKDRGAVSMAGRAGKAFWMSTDTGDFVTSSYYYDSYPTWVAKWNAKRQVEKLGGTQWTLLYDPSGYLLAHQDDRAYEVDLRGYGRVFPHRFADARNPLLPTQVIASPAGDRLTWDFAKALLQEERLGADDVPDYLAISFSGVDAVNHFFGPSSLENEDMVLQLDRTLEDLFAFVDETVGLDRTLIVLSADHGMAEMPEYMTELGFEAGRLHSEDVLAAADRAGRERFGIEGISRFYYRPYLYLDSEKIESKGLNVNEVQAQLAAWLSEEPGIAQAIHRDGLDGPQATPMRQRVQRNFHPARSGDIYIVQDAYWFHFDRGPVAAMHGSPWSYDVHVPILFAGPGIERRIVTRRVHPVDVAPTLSAYLGMTAPGSASGTILTEIIADD